MKLIQTLLATTLTLAASVTFAASAHDDKSHAKKAEEKVVVSTQEQPATDVQPVVVDATASETAPAASTPATSK